MALIPSSGKKPENGKTADHSAEDEVLLREIDDAVRQDDYARFAKTYGRPLLGLLVLGLAVFGGYLFWQSRQEAALEKQSEDLVAALDQADAGNIDSASKQAKQIPASKDAAHYSALLLQAAIAAQKHQTDEAVRLYGEVAEDPKAPQVLRDLAQIRGVTTNFDKRDPAEIVKLLKPLAVPENPWFGSAGELVAMAYLEQNKPEEAGKLFAQIAKDENQPKSLRERARQMAGLLGVDAIVDVKKLLEEQNEAPPGAPPAPGA